jgi:hypothetical protein
MKTDMERRLYDLDAAATYLGRAKSGVRHLIYSGELPVVQMGERGKQYVDIHDLNEYIRRYRKTLGGLKNEIDPADSQ